MASRRSLGDVAQVVVITVADEYPLELGSEHERHGVAVAVADAGRKHLVVSRADGCGHVGKREVAPYQH